MNRAPAFLVDMLQQHKVDISKLEGTTVTSGQLDAPIAPIADILPVLYQNGYFTINEYDSEFQLYTLACPNEEVREELTRFLAPIMGT